MNYSQAYRSKQALSWMVISEIYKRILEPCTVAELHPGGGLYNTLALVTSHPVVQLNRNGSSALVSGSEEVLNDIWIRALRDPTETGLFILSESDLEAYPEITEQKRQQVNAMMKIGNALWEYKDLETDLVWGWVDGQGSFASSGITVGLDLPVDWKTYPGTYMGNDWRAQIWILTHEGNPVYAFNLYKGEIHKFRTVSPIILRESEIDEFETLSPVIALEVWVAKASSNELSAVVHPSQKREVARFLDVNGEISFRELHDLNSVQSNIFENFKNELTQLN